MVPEIGPKESSAGEWWLCCLPGPLLGSAGGADVAALLSGKHGVVEMRECREGSR